MGNRKLISMLLIGLSCSVIVLSGCTQQKANTIVVGTSADYPPFESKAANGTIIGFDIDLIKKVLTDEGYKVEVRDIAFDSLIPELQQGRVDVIAAAMTINAERQAQVSFSRPYYDANQSVLVKIGSGVNVTNVSTLAKYIVGAQTGTTGWEWVNSTLVATDKMSPDRFRSYESALLAVADLQAGSDRLGALVIDSPVADAFADKRPVYVAYTITTNESYGFAVKIGNTALLSKIDSGLANVTGSTFWKSLVDQYFAS